MSKNILKNCKVPYIKYKRIEPVLLKNLSHACYDNVPFCSNLWLSFLLLSWGVYLKCFFPLASWGAAPSVTLMSPFSSMRSGVLAVPEVPTAPRVQSSNEVVTWVIMTEDRRLGSSASVLHGSLLHQGIALLNLAITCSKNMANLFSCTNLSNNIL